MGGEGGGRYAGYVLTGGASSRMGRDKAALPYRGGTLAEAVARAVAEAAGSAILVGNPERNPGAIPDLYPGEGPLGGILTALHHTRAEWNLVVACDMPEIDGRMLRALLERAEQERADALLPAGPSGLPEPLCAVYRLRVLEALEEAFARGVRKITAALGDRMRTAPVHWEFHNVNTPEDWARYAE
ncbi:MAG TPA: molybdenum cofactor guanylyltransferase [Bryobacteraceae bacterium]|jgi:molybdopterin-guanine dinucleotide biosynthesis protein A